VAPSDEVDTPATMRVMHPHVDSVICGDDIDRINLVRLRLSMPKRLDAHDMRDLARMLTGVLQRATPVKKEGDL
jgi:hypothetical protein